jgi:hypothetical protein
MLDITTIETALYTWIYGVTGVQTIFAHPNAPRPASGQYITIHIANAVSKGIAENKNTAGANDTVDVDYSNLDELLVSINTFRTGAQQLCTKIRDSLARTTVLETLYASGLGYSRSAGVNEVQEVVNKRWEERSRFDCFFYTRTLDEENIEAIKKIQVIDEIDELEGNMCWNSGFDDDINSYWEVGLGCTIANGVASFNGSQPSWSYVRQKISISPDNVLYKITFDVVEISAGLVLPRFWSAGPVGIARSEVGSYDDYLRSDGTQNGTFGIRVNVDFIGKLDNVTCKRVMEIE